MQRKTKGKERKEKEKEIRDVLSEWKEREIEEFWMMEENTQERLKCEYLILSETLAEIKMLKL